MAWLFEVSLQTSAPQKGATGRQTHLFPKTPRIRLCFTARVTYPVSEISWSLPGKQKKISYSEFINDLRHLMFILWMFQMSFISRREEAIMSSQETTLDTSTLISGLSTPIQIPIC